MPTSTFRTDFKQLTPDMTVDAARRLMGWGMRGGLTYGIVVDSQDHPLALLGVETIANWPETATLADMRLWWPVLHTLPQIDAGRLGDAARFFAGELREHEDLLGIVLVDADGRTIAVVERTLLLSAQKALETVMRHGGPETPTAKGPEPVSGPEDLMVTRYGRLQCPRQVPLNQPVALRVTINRVPTPNEAGQVELGLTARKWPLKVIATLVGLSPEDFLVTGPASGVIEVPAQADSEPLEFALVPQSLGRKLVRVRFEQDNAYLGTAFVHTEIVEAQAAGAGQADVWYPPVLQTAGPSPDVTLYIERAKNDGLTYTVKARLAGDDPLVPPREIDAITFPRPPDAYMQAMYDDLDTMTKQGLTPDEFDDEVLRISFNLYDELFHVDGFKTFYYAVMAQLPDTATVQVVSDEPHVPWELVRPFRQRTDGHWESEPGPLCERFIFSRWLSGPAPAAKLALHRVALVAPPSNLAYVANEVAAIRRIQDVDVALIETKPALVVFLKSQETDSLHFACHGRFNADLPGRSAVQLGNRFLRPADITAENRNFGRNRPLVFLNACDSGRLGLGLTGLDGWAIAFRNAGAGCFIGSVWSTSDDLACKFAEVFYARLRSGDTIGEAMRQARFAVMQPGNATHLSYTLYANPCARLA